MGSQVSEMERALGAIAEDVARFRATLDGRGLHSSTFQLNLSRF
jgi:hypothetical protein